MSNSFNGLIKKHPSMEVDIEELREEMKKKINIAACKILIIATITGIGIGYLIGVYL